MLNQAKAIDVLHLENTQAEQLGRDLNRQDDASTDASRRRHGRFAYLIPEGITVEVESPAGGSSRAYRVCPRNISCGGMAFLHGGFIHPGTRCHITLVALDDERVSVGATIRTCSYVGGKVHHVGVQFDSPIKVADFSHDCNTTCSDAVSEARGNCPAPMTGRDGPTANEATAALHELQALARTAEQVIKQLQAGLASLEQAFSNPPGKPSRPRR